MITIAALALATAAGSATAATFGLESLDLQTVEQGWGQPHANKSVDGNPLFIDGKKYDHGLGTHAVSMLRIALGGNGERFTAAVGVDDEVGDKGSVTFKVIGDGKTLWESGVLKGGSHAQDVTVGLNGVKTLILSVGDGGDDINYDHADWADAQIVMREGSPTTLVPNPSAQRGRPLNNTVLVQWSAISSACASAFDRYAIYRATNSFTSVVDMVAIATISDYTTTNYLDTTVTNGVAYYYAVTTVTQFGGENQSVSSVGSYTPCDETDLQVVTLSRTPRFPRYAAQYTDYTTNEPSGFGPYSFSAATGLGNGQTAGTARWPTNGQPVTFTATVRNRGANAWPGAIHGAWSWDGVRAEIQTNAGPLAPDAVTQFSITRSWDGLRHTVQFSLMDPDARTNNNTRAMDAKSVAALTYVDQTYYEHFRASSLTNLAATTDDLFDWLNANMDRLNQMFEEANSPKRVHLDVLEMLTDGAPDPSADTIAFAVFPFRFYASEEGDYRQSGYYDASEDIDYGYLHEMGHQLGLIDIYQMDVPADANLVSHQGYSAVPDLMHGCSHFFSTNSALAMTHWEDQAHGYFGQYLYGLPAQINMRFLGADGLPLTGATVKMYQFCNRPDLGQVISTQIKAQGITDSDGVWMLPNVPLNTNLVPALPTGDTLKDNPFGYLAVVGNNGVLHFVIQKDGFTDYTWLDVTEPNSAFYQGQTNSATFTRNLSLGGTIQLFPPAEMSEMGAQAWACWAQGSAAGNTWVTNDSSPTRCGTNSIKFVTDGGFDTYVRYPGNGMALWDLAGVENLKISFWASNASGNTFQSGTPWIRLKDRNGGYFQYQYYAAGDVVDILNNAFNQWYSVAVPLHASDTETDGWRCTTSGSPSLASVSSLEIHMDTWGAGFEVWLDCVSFEPTPEAPGLSAVPQDGAMLLSWPAIPSDYSLQSSAAVDGPYTNYPGTSTSTNGVRSLLVPVTDAKRFFRLGR